MRFVALCCAVLCCGGAGWWTAWLQAASLPQRALHARQRIHSTASRVCSSPHLLPSPPTPPSPAETKRSEFPRFYFVSDPTLLEILSLGSDPPAVVPHFQSGLFDSLSNVTFDKVGQGGSVGLFAGSVDTG